MTSPDVTGDAQQNQGGDARHRDAGTQAAPKITPLHDVHQRLGAALVPFAGWLMPLRYRSETAEHNAVRTAAGLFDLSHMGEIFVRGPGAPAALDYAVVGEPSALAPGRARYTMICAPDGGVLDDLIVYRLGDEEYLVVANAANTGVVYRELSDRAAQAAGRAAIVADETPAYALIAIQGPRAAEVLSRRIDVPLEGIKYYTAVRASVAGIPVLAARTGYTGEDGFELFCPADAAGGIWAALEQEGSGDGLIPAGLAARDTLRLEAGMPLYGNELSTDITPFEAGLGRVVKLDKQGDFVGRDALAERARSGPRCTLIGLFSRTRRVPRHGYPVLLAGEPAGTVTSGAPSPTLGRPIAMAYVQPEAAKALGEKPPDSVGETAASLAVDVRGRTEAADYAQLPFYRRAK